MTTAFDRRPYGSMPFTDPNWVRQKVLEACRDNEWTAMGALYPATSRRVRRELLHAVLKQMLAARELRLRIVPVVGAADRTEFKRIPQQS